MDERLYHVYILASRSRVFYIGVTSKLLSRMKQHREGSVRGFTSRYRIQRLVHLETFHDVRIALGREKELKEWNRAKKMALIAESNPTWEDLAGNLFAKISRKADPSPQKTEARDDKFTRVGPTIRVN
jgi:putative endonuclease